MTTTKYALKRLENAGAKIEYHDNEIIGRLPKASVSFYNQDGEAICIYFLRNGMHDDHQSDYFAGMFYNSISSAIRHAAEI